MSSNKSTLSLFFILCVLLLSSCAPVKNIAYFQKLDTKTDSLNQNQVSDIEKARFKPQDLISIIVVTTQPETSRIYNLITPSVSDNISNNLTSQPVLQNYLVDYDGNIDFPVLGKLHVQGKTRKELLLLLQEKLASAFNNELPIITIRITNYSVDVVGEVVRPGKFNTINDRMTIFDGIAMAGDLTIYGKRENVKVLRENADGSKKFITVNLNDKNIINSPAYYLEQNDVVYVEPNKSRSNASHFGAAESFGISALSILISISSLMFNVLKN